MSTASGQTGPPSANPPDITTDLQEIKKRIDSIKTSIGIVETAVGNVKTTVDGVNRTRQRRYVINLGLILLFGVLGCWWVLYYSDWFEIVGGLLTLGGAFAWLAFVSKILRDDRIKELQSWVEKVILERKWVTVVCLLLLFVAVLLPGLFLGTIQVESVQEPSDLGLSIYCLGSKQGPPKRLPAGGSVRTVLWTTWSKSEYVVKVSGYPDHLERLHPLARRVLRVPNSFRRPIILVRPSPRLADAIQQNGKTLTASLTRTTGKVISVGKRDNYTGQALWIGCDDEVQVPQAIQDGWLRELAAQQHVKLASSWRRPETLGDPRLELKSGDIIRLELRRQDNSLFVEGSVVVQSPVGENFVIEEVLDVPSQ